MALSVYNRQKQSLTNMLLSCTSAADPFEDSDDVWKVLIYDVVGRDILAPLLSVAELRSTGVTLHMLLNKVRHTIPDVPAVYFVQPTKENVQRIVSDSSKGMYASLWVNFTDCASREVLEALAEGMASVTRPNPLAGRISRVYDMYASFHSLQHNLFSLNLPGTYAALNATKVTNAEMEGLVATITERLFCMVVTTGVVPIIRALKGGPANMVASMLDARLREHLKASNNTFAESGSFASVRSERPLLVIIDRALDIPVMLHHPWTYQALVHDVLSLKLNRVNVTVKEGDGDSSGSGGKRTFDLDQGDSFWTEHAGQAFPLVAEAVERALGEYRNEVAELNRSTGTFGEEDMEALNGQGGDKQAADNLAAALSSIPELGKQKRNIDLHTNIATALLDEIKKRGLDGYFQVEEDLLSRPGTFDVERILAVLRDARGSQMDKLRLFLMYYLCVDGTSDEDVERCLTTLKAGGCDDVRAYRYLKSIRAFTKNMSTKSATQLSASSSLSGAYAASVLDTLSQVANNVNKLMLSDNKALGAARDVQALMEAKVEADVAERYVTLDAKAPKGSGAGAGMGRGGGGGSGGGGGVGGGGGGGGGSGSGGGFKECMVFVVGAGNYVEFQNCQDHVCSKVMRDGKTQRMVSNGKTVVYGATELCTGSEFIEQLHANGIGEEKDIRPGVESNNVN